MPAFGQPECWNGYRGEATRAGVCGFSFAAKDSTMERRFIGAERWSLAVARWIWQARESISVPWQRFLGLDGYLVPGNTWAYPSGGRSNSLIGSPVYR